jgi:hypothetical protein
MIASNFKKALKEAENKNGWYPSVFVYENLSNEVEFTSEKEAFDYIKSSQKKSNPNAIYYPINGYYFAIDVDCDIIRGIKEGILKKSDALKLLKISKKRSYMTSYQDKKEIEDLLDEKFPCNSELHGMCNNCCNCD